MESTFACELVLAAADKSEGAWASSCVRRACFWGTEGVEVGEEEGNEAQEALRSGAAIHKICHTARTAFLLGLKLNISVKQSTRSAAVKSSCAALVPQSFTPACEIHRSAEVGSAVLRREA